MPTHSRLLPFWKMIATQGGLGPDQEEAAMVAVRQKMREAGIPVTIANGCCECQQPLDPSKDEVFLLAVEERNEANEIVSGMSSWYCGACAAKTGMLDGTVRVT
jgi:hypothetical protein